MKILRMVFLISFSFFVMVGLISVNICAADKCDNPMEARPIPLTYSECMDVCAECNRQAVAECDMKNKGDTNEHKKCLKDARDKYDSIRQECTIFNK